jgi:hypothetical protein
MGVCECNSECECVVGMVTVVDLLQRCGLPTPHAALSGGVEVDIV